MNILSILARENPRILYYLVVPNIRTGIFSALIITLALNGICDIVEGINYIFYMFLIPANAILLILSKHSAHSKLNDLSENVQNKLILRIINNFRRAELEVVENKNLTEIYSQIVNAQTITTSIQKFADSIQHSTSIICLWIYIAYLSVILAVIFFIIFLFIVYSYILTQELLKPVIEKEFTHKTEMYEQMSHILNGFKELKISQPQNDDIFHNYLSQAINQTQNTRFSSLASHTHFLLIVNVSFYFVIGLTSFVFTTYFEQNLLIQVMTIYIFMWTPTLSILTAIPYIQNGQIALKQLMSLIKEFGDSDDETIPVNISEHEPINSFKRIYFDKLTYKYQQKAKSTTFCVGPLNLEIHSGEIIFITGGNGCGKTTLLKLITGLYQPLLGNVYIDQKYVNIADHRYLFSAIFSDFYLFDKLYGFDKIDKQQIDHLLATMALNKKVEWVDKHFSTKKLSTGERKRLALIAALLEDRPIYVFDEWAADQDTYFRHYFYETLLPLLKQQGKTVIVVTHDDTFFHLADQHIRLNYGQLENK